MPVLPRRSLRLSRLQCAALLALGAPPLVCFGCKLAMYVWWALECDWVKGVTGMPTSTLLFLAMLCTYIGFNQLSDLKDIHRLSDFHLLA